jgi:two-component system OmpR family sensor kinase
MGSIGGIYPEGIPSTFHKTAWQTLQDAQGTRYHQISLSLHTQDNRDWGYIQVGRSLKYFDDYLNSMKLIFFLGLPLSMILIGGASWWLSGLAMQPIYRSYGQIQQFTADATHELRTPLAASQATVESALRMPYISEQEARDILQTTHRQNQRLIQLVTDLLLLARLDRQPVPIPQQLCCLNDIISDLIEELTAFAQSAEIELISRVMLTYPLTIIGNEDQLYRLISNLIVNAIKYTSTGGKVEVILDRHDHHAVIQICDTGIGIAPQEQQRIFDRFYRVDSDRSRDTGGSGLGLAIAAAIVKAHKGSLQVQSELGKGSIFTVQFAL